MLPAGVASVSSTGSASSSDAELRATSPLPPTQGSSRPASSAPATTIVAASLARVRVRDSAFSDIGARDTCRRAATCRRGQARRAGRIRVRGVPVGVSSSAPVSAVAHHPQPVEVVHVAGGGRHGADGDLRVRAGEPVGEVLLARGLRHALGVHPQRRGGEVGPLGAGLDHLARPRPRRGWPTAAVVAGGWVRLSTRPASGMPSADSRSTK